MTSASEQMRTKRKEENWSFTPLVFAANGGMGKECIRIYKRLAEIVADKEKHQFRLLQTILEP